MHRRSHPGVCARGRANSGPARSHRVVHPLPTATVFTPSDLRQLGWSDSAIARAVRSRRLIRLRRGVYTIAEVDGRVAALGAARALADSVISHRSALVLHGLPVLGRSDFLPELTVSPTSRGSAHQVHLHRASLRAEDVTVVDGALVTAVARTLSDVARHRPILLSVAALDAALYRGFVDLEQLDDVLRFCRNWPRIRRANLAVRLADGRAESPLESVSRVVMGWMGVPRPEPQALIFDEYGRFVGRSDFYWDAPGVVGEADGRSKYVERDILNAEKDRQEDIEDPGVVVTRWGWRHAMYQRELFRTKLERAFQRGHARDRAGLPRLWSVQLTAADGSRGKALRG